MKIKFDVNKAMKDFVDKMFDGAKTETERRNILIAEHAILDVTLRDFNIEILESFIKASRKNGLSWDEIKKELRANDELLKSMFDVNTLNKIYTKCRQEEKPNK